MCGDAYAKFAAEVESAREKEVDFCLSLPDRRRGALDVEVQRGVDLAPMTATRALNEASNSLLRAAAYGDRSSVEEVGVGLVALQAELSGWMDTYPTPATRTSIDVAGPRDGGGRVRPSKSGSRGQCVSDVLRGRCGSSAGGSFR